MLPGLDGVSVAVRIMFVSARVEEVDRLVGLDAGADDCVCKPFIPREVVARVKAVLRRPAATVGPAGKVRVGPPELDELRRTVVSGGQRSELTGSEFRLLQALMRRPGQVFSRSLLLGLLHGHGEEPLDRAIETHVKNLRKKLGMQAALIRSVYGAGYQLDV